MTPDRRTFPATPSPVAARRARRSTTPPAADNAVVLRAADRFIMIRALEEMAERSPSLRPQVDAVLRGLNGPPPRQRLGSRRVVVTCF
jgi:hypothetical protein